MPARLPGESGSGRVAQLAALGTEMNARASLFAVFFFADVFLDGPKGPSARAGALRVSVRQGTGRGAWRPELA